MKRPETMRQVEFGPRQWEQPPSHLSSRELETLDQQSTSRRFYIAVQVGVLDMYQARGAVEGGVYIQFDV